MSDARLRDGVYLLKFFISPGLSCGFEPVVDYITCLLFVNVLCVVVVVRTHSLSCP